METNKELGLLVLSSVDLEHVLGLAKYEWLEDAFNAELHLCGFDEQIQQFQYIAIGESQKGVVIANPFYVK